MFNVDVEGRCSGAIDVHLYEKMACGLATVAQIHAAFGSQTIGQQVRAIIARANICLIAAIWLRYLNEGRIWVTNDYAASLWACQILGVANRCLFSSSSLSENQQLTRLVNASCCQR